MASLVAPGDGRPGGHRRLRQGRSRPGRAPGARAADNGAAPGPSRRGVTGPPGRGTCAPWASNPPPADPTGPPPTGDNERFHQTLLRHPGRQPLADSIAEPPGDGSTASTTPCNTQRPHQGLPGRITGQQAQDATEIAQAPRPRHDTGPIAPAGPSPEPDTTDGPRVRWRRPIGSTGRRELTIARNGTAHIGGIAFLVNRALAGSKTIAIWDADTITFADVHGEVLIQYNWPPQGTAYVSHHPPDPTNQRARPRPQKAPTVTEVLTHRTSPMS